MANLDAAQKRNFAKVIRAQLEISRELWATRLILEYHEKNNLCPTRWKDSLAEMKTADSYKSVGREFEAMIALLERNADEIDLDALLEQLPKGTPIQ